MRGEATEAAECAWEWEGRKRDIFMFRFNREIQILSGYFVNQIRVKKTGLRDWIEVGLSGLI